MSSKKSKPERKRRHGSYKRKRKKLLEQKQYKCERCGFSIKEQVDHLGKLEYENNHGLSKKEFNEYKSLILSQLQIHHIIPLSSNGKNSSSNLMVLCEECHIEVDKEIDELKLKINDTSIARVIVQGNKKYVKP